MKKVKPAEISLEIEGAYVFRGPTEIVLQLNHELLVVFAMPSLECSGVVLCDTNTKAVDLCSMLDRVLGKLSALSDSSEDISIKLFGMSGGYTPLMDSLQGWIKNHGLKIVSQDIGKNVARNLTLECATGKVRVSYAETYRSAVPPFIDIGSARERFKETSPQTKILVLAHNRVKAILAKQAIEENPNCSATLSQEPGHFFDENLVDFCWSHVFLFEDMAKETSLKRWIKGLREFLPSVQIYWVGHGTPAYARSLPHLPSFEAESVPAFKKALNEVLVETLSISDVIPFRKQKKK